MLKYIVKRLLISVIILLGVSVIIYALVRCMPTDYIDIKFADAAMTNEGVAERIQEFKEMYGIADNSFGGILKGYFSWIGNLFKGDFGTSFIHEVPVTQVIAEHMWISFGIALVAVILQFLIAIPLGITSATHQYSARDYSVTVFTMIGLSLPTYFSRQSASSCFRSSWAGSLRRVRSTLRKFIPKRLQAQCRNSAICSTV